MTPSFVVACDTVRGIFHQKLILAIVLVAFAGTAALLQFTQQQKARVQYLGETQSEGPAETGSEHETNAKSDHDSQVDKDQRAEQISFVMQAFFFTFASGCGTLVSLGLFTTLLATPIGGGELRAILARPITRWQYLLGRTAGAIVGLGVYWALMGIAFGVYNLLQAGSLPPATRYAAALYLSKGIMVGCVGMALSLYVRPLVATAIALVGSSDWVSPQSALYMILPGDDRLSVANQVLHGTTPAIRDVLLGVLYAADTTLIALAVAWLRFRRTDIG